jgi:hypothetical protein
LRIQLFPQLNLRQWSGAIYTWLTQPVLDPTNSGRVTMDSLMKLVTTALEWSFEASEANVRAETLERAAELLVLRRDTLRIIDGAGPTSEDLSSEPPKQEYESERPSEQESVSVAPASPPTNRREKAEEQAPTGKPPKCTFSGVVVIELQRFLDSDTHLVECPDCAATRSLKPHRGVIRFPSHEKRKTRTPQASQRWAKGRLDWDVAHGE